jgi:hypothetical protein
MVDGNRQAGVKVEITPDMLDAGVAALWEAGIVEHESSSGDRMVICEILQAALGAEGIALQIRPRVWLAAQTSRPYLEHAAEPT